MEHPSFKAFLGGYLQAYRPTFIALGANYLLWILWEPLWILWERLLPGVGEILALFVLVYWIVVRPGLVPWNANASEITDFVWGGALQDAAMGFITFNAVALPVYALAPAASRRIRLGLIALSIHVAINLWRAHGLNQPGLAL